MATRKSFQTYQPTETQEIELNGAVFPLVPTLPGAVLLDYLSNTNTESPGAMALVVVNLLDSAIAADHLDRWHAFIRDPAQNITLDVLSEVAGYVSEVLSSGNPQSQSLMSSAG